MSHFKDKVTISHENRSNQLEFIDNQYVKDVDGNKVTQSELTSLWSLLCRDTLCVLIFLMVLNKTIILNCI